jgi:hypothetical protein
VSRWICLVKRKSWQKATGSGRVNGSVLRNQAHIGVDAGSGVDAGVLRELGMVIHSWAQQGPTSFLSQRLLFMSTVPLTDLNADFQERQAEMAQFQAKADRQRREVMDAVMQKLIEKISTYGIAAKESGFNLGKAPTHADGMSGPGPPYPGAPLE